MTLNLQNWSRLSELLDVALELPENQRLAWLDSLVEEDIALKTQLRELLTASSHGETFLHKHPDFSAALLEEAQHFQQFEVELQADRLIGSYRLLRELGLGGMGAVWLAQRVDGKFKREVALKFPYAGPHQRQLTERLLRERDILASLQHANIARLYDADVTASGQPFLVLEYIDGIDITSYCDQHQLDIRERLMLFQQVLSAVRYAHTHLVIHRDLKPSNILITTDGIAHLLDFGIATSITDGEVRETPLTKFGGHLLTLEYASPEQAAKIPVTTASDVYALGVVLYELLTGTSPYQHGREQRAQLEEAIANADVMLPSRAVISDKAAAFRNIKPRQLSKALRGELDTLLLKALKKDIDARYASADAFYQDISRFLDHQPIHAQPDSQWYRVRKFARRNRTAVVSFAAIAIALISGTGIALWQAHVASQQRDRAIALATRGEAVTEFMRLMVTEIADVDEPITMQTLLARTEEVASKTFADNKDQQIAVLNVLGQYYSSLQRSKLALQSLNKALKLAANSADVGLKAQLNCNIGSAYYEMGDIKTARHFSEVGLALSEGYPEVQAECLQIHAFIIFETEGADSMLKDLQLAEKKLNSSEVYQPMFAVDLLKSIADAETELGQIVDARQKYALAIEQLKKMGRGEQYLAMRVYDSWAIADGAAGDPRNALEHIDKAQEITRKRGIHKNDSARYSFDRAIQLYHLANYEEALKEYQSAISYNQDNGNLATIIDAKQGIVRVMLELGRIAEAERLIREIKSTISNSELNANRVFALHNTELDGLLAMKQYRYADAIHDFSINIDYLVNHNELGGALTYSLRLRGGAYLTDNNIAAALLDATQSYKIARSVQGELPFSSYSGKAALLLAKIETKRNQPEAAHKWVTIAYQQLQESLGDDHPTTLEAKHLLNSL